MNEFEFLESIKGFLKSLYKWIPTIFIAMTSSWISIQFQLKKKKINSIREAWWAGIMAFALSMMVGYIVSLRFDPFISHACTAASGVFMKDFITWVFNNHEQLFSAIAAKFNIHLTKKDETTKNEN